MPEPGEEGSFAAANGHLSLDGAQRVRNALLHAAYGDSNLVSSLAETGDENIKSFGGVLSDSAGRVAQLRRDIVSGAVHPGADLSSPLLVRRRVVQIARMNGQKLSQTIAQQDAFNPISAEADSFFASGTGRTLMVGYRVITCGPPSMRPRRKADNRRRKRVFSASLNRRARF